MGGAAGPTVLLIGLGGLGGVILEFLARDPAPGRLVGADRDTGRGEARANVARLGAFAQGLQPRLDFVPLDLDAVDQSAEVVRAIRPDLVLSTASLQTWWLTALLPPADAERLGRARFGAWLPLHLAPTLKLMDVLQAAGYRGPTLTAPFPDVVNVVLGRRGPAPTCGIGNVDEIVPKIASLAAGRLRVPLASVRVVLVAHHAVEAVAFGGVAEATGVPPHYLRVEHEGRDVTGEVDAEALLLSPYPLPPGPSWHFLTAACATRLVHALLGENEELRHVPGPAGLPGGYPAWVSRHGLRVADVPGLAREAAIALNEDAHRFDGVERIEADGTVVFSDPSVAALRDALGYNCPRLAPADAAGRALELKARFREYAWRCGVDLDRIARAIQ